jgi:hypothetical protein
MGTLQMREESEGNREPIHYSVMYRRVQCQSKSKTRRKSNSWRIEKRRGEGR